MHKNDVANKIYSLHGIECNGGPTFFTFKISFRPNGHYIVKFLKLTDRSFL